MPKEDLINTKKFSQKFSHIRFKIAVRSLGRHRLRSFLSISTMAGAVCAIILFHGLSDFFLSSLREVAAENQYGNMQIAKEKYWEPGKENRKMRMFSLDELKHLTANSKVEKVSGRISFFGLVSNSDLSLGGRIIGIDTISEPNFKKSVTMSSGKFFKNETTEEGIIGYLLAKQMNVKTGDSITLLTNTVDGVMNAVDITVSGIFTAGLDEIDSQVVFIPLAMSQSILNTKDVDIAVLKFKSPLLAEENVVAINNELKKDSANLKARSWRELAGLYRQVEKFYQIQNRIIELILITLTFLGILNSVSMTVVERTGEIGTLRSFGETRSQIIGQFMLENIIMSSIGIMAGIIVAAVIAYFFQFLHLYTEMPGSSEPMPMDINFLLGSVIYAAVITFLCSLMATYIPAKRAAGMNILEALRKNI